MQRIETLLTLYSLYTIERKGGMRQISRKGGLEKTQSLRQAEEGEKSKQINKWKGSLEDRSLWVGVCFLSLHLRSCSSSASPTRLKSQFLLWIPAR